VDVRGNKYFFLNPKNRCKRCGVVASFDAIVTPPTLTLFHISLSVGGPAALLCSALSFDFWLLATLGPADRHQSPIGRRLDRFCPILFWLFKSVKCRVNSGLTTIVVPVPQPESAASIDQVFIIESHFYIFKSTCLPMLLHRFFVTRWPTLWLLYNNNNVPCPVCVCMCPAIQQLGVEWL
jgi:hypothetical protein